MKHLELKVGIPAVLVVGLVLAGCLLYTPIMINRHTVGLRSENDKAKAEAVTWFLAHGERGKNILRELLGVSKEEFEFIEKYWEKRNKPIEGDMWGRYPLHFAAIEGYAKVADLLIACGADVNARDNIIRATPLACAAANGRTETVRVLIEKGSDTNVKDFNGGTPLHEAVERGHTETARFLIEKGAEVNAKNKSNYTPLDLAIQLRKSETADFLRSRGGRKWYELEKEVKQKK